MTFEHLPLQYDPLIQTLKHSNQNVKQSNC